METKLPKRLKKENRTYMPKRPRRSIKVDSVHPGDLRKYQPAFFCDDCSHYSASTGGVCTLGYRAQHTREEQMKLYNLTGKIACCRAIEIE
jgi:hypothetical protein